MSTGLGIDEGRLRHRAAVEGLAALVWEQARSGFLWLPVLMIGGIFTYYGFAAPPPLAPVAIGALAALPLVLLRFPLLRLCLMGWIMFAAGFLLSGMEMDKLKGQGIDGETVARVRGVIETIETRENDQRLLIRVQTFKPDITQSATPSRIRITARKVERPFLPGDGVWLRGRLFPPPEAVSPFGYQFARWAYFREIGAVGYAFGTVRAEESADGGGLLTGLNRLRERIAQRIERHMEGDAAALTIALSTGLRDRLSDRLEENLRAAGLAHILAISGLHMALLAGGVFWLIRFCLALVPSAGQVLPVKKIAAVAGLVAALCYLGLSGGAVSTQRAFVMVSIAFLAILLDRPAISMRNLALAAIIVAALNPSAVTEPGFQMSFAATAGLIGVYAAMPSRWKRRPAEALQIGKPGVGSRAFVALLRLLGFTFLTTFVAAIATAPFSSFHFERVAAYGLVGNMAVMPLFSFAVMPLIVCSLVLMPLGLEGLPLTVLTLVLEPLFQISASVAGWPGAMIDVGRQSVLLTALISLAGLWLILARGRIRLLGFAGLLLLPFLREPGYDLYASADGKSVIARMADGSFARASSRGSDFAYDIWLSHEGRSRDLESRAFATSRDCGEDVCLLQSAVGLVAVAESKAAFCAAPAARDASLLILQEQDETKKATPGRPEEGGKCALPHLTFSQDWNAAPYAPSQTLPSQLPSAFALRKTEGGVEIIDARETLGAWPWVR